MPANMRSTKRPTIGVFAMKTLGAAVASALLFSNAHAAALGKLTVLSALGQPLQAEIALRAVAPDEAASLSAKLASPEAFRQANIEFNPALMSLKFAIEQRAGQRVIRVTSGQPLNEPFVDMLVELSGPDGRLIREYTFLLDPADLRTMQPAQAAPLRTPQQAAPAAAPSSSGVQRSPLPPAANARQAGGAERGNRQASEYRVKSGDTLAGIAEQYRSSGVSLDQMLVALYQANPDAFIDKNMNRMKAGEILSVPSADTAAAIGNKEARGIVLAQAADFNRYRSMLANQVAGGAARKSAEGSQSASGKITARVEEKASPASQSKDKLKLSNALAAKGGANAAGGAETPEDRIAREKAIEEANNRIKELEKNVSDLQKILEMKNRSLAEQQKQAQTAPIPKTAAPAAPVKPAAPPAIKVKPPAHAPSPEPSLMDEVLGNPLLLPGLGALLVALGALGIYSARRKKRSRPFEDSIITDSSLKANSLFGSTGGQNVDTSNSVFNSSFSPSVSQLDSNEVDPVAEADVYIAYGRDAQAEEILKEALRTQPQRHAVRVKLLEIYSNRKDLRAFEVLATELYGMTRGEGEEWKQAAAMGAAIDPDNPLYAGAQAAAAETGSMHEEELDAHHSDALPQSGDAPALVQPSQSGLQMGNGQFDGSLSLDNPPLELETGDEPAAGEQPVVTDTKSPSNELDFDLDGMMADLEVPNTLVPPAPAEPAAEMASIDFDFLDTSGGHPAEATAEATAEPEPTLDPVSEIEPTAEPATLELPSLDETVPTEAKAETETGPIDFELPLTDEKPSAASAPAEADPLDFDLSGISLELDPGTGRAATEADREHDEDQVATATAPASDAEMATKLDLALAYQEIGDKEGARELLDEVLKGGSAEQSERAKALLLELA